MLDQETSERVRRFVQRFCAVDNGRAPRAGRFTFSVGRSARKATHGVREPVPFGAFDPTLIEVLDVVGDLIESREGNVWVRAYYTGSSNYTLQLTIPGAMDEDPEDPENLAADASMAGALVRCVSMLLGANGEKDRMLERYHKQQVDGVARMTHLMVRERYTDAAVQQAAAREFIGQVTPILGQLAPVVAEWLLRQGASDGRPLETPADVSSLAPADQLAQHVQEIVASVTRIGAVVAANGGRPPDGSEASLRTLRELVMQLGPALQLDIAPAGVA